MSEVALTLRDYSMTAPVTARSFNFARWDSHRLHGIAVAGGGAHALPADQLTKPHAS
jgi:hypothetical protein